MIGRLYDFIFSKQSERFLRKNTSRLTRTEVETAVIKSIQRITHEEVNSADVIEMKGRGKGVFRTRFGGIRIVFSYLEGAVRIVTIDTIDFRGSVYH